VRQHPGKQQPLTFAARAPARFFEQFTARGLRQQRPRRLPSRSQQRLVPLAIASLFDRFT
jgi:hypothetical protein